MNTQTEKDFLAVISLSGVAGSYARGKDKADAVKRAAIIFRQDFRDHYNFKKGSTVKVNVIEVTGHDTIWWNESGFFAGETKLDRPVETIEHAY